MDNSAGNHDGAGTEAAGNAPPGAEAQTGTESRWEVFLHAIRGTGGDPTAGSGTARLSARHTCCWPGPPSRAA